MLTLGIGIGITGWLNVSDVGGETFEEIHELFANAMLVVVMLHILGVIASSFMHRANLAKAMVTGYKPGLSDEGIRTSHGIIGALLIVTLAIFGWVLSQGQLPTLLDPAAISTEQGDGGIDHDNDDD